MALPLPKKPEDEIPVPTGLLPPAPAPAPVDPVLAGYATSRAGVGTRFQGATDEIGRQETQATGLLNTLPGAYAGIYDTAGKSMQASANTLAGAQQAGGLNSYMSADAMLAPMQTAMAQQKAGFDSSVPLLHVGAKDTYSRQRASLDQAKMAELGDIDKEESGYLAQLAAEERDRKAKQDAADADRAFQEQQRAQATADAKAEAAADRNFRAGEAGKDRAATLAAKAADRANAKSDWKEQAEWGEASDIRKEGRVTTAAEAAARPAAAQMAPGQVSWAKGQELLRDPARRGEVDEVKRSKAYIDTRRDFLKKNFKPGETDKAREWLLNYAKGKQRDRTLSLLLAEGGFDDSDLPLAAMRGTPPAPGTLSKKDRDKKVKANRPKGGYRSSND